MTGATAAAIGDTPAAVEIAVGTPVYGDWGAMFPHWYGRVVAVVPSGYQVQWEDQEDAPEPSYVERIRQETPATGSPIGVYVDHRALQRHDEN